MEDDQEFERRADAMLYLLHEVAARKQLSHQGIADMIGWKQTNVSRLFAGKYPPTLPNFLKLTNALGIRVILESGEGNLESELQKILDGKKML